MSFVSGTSWSGQWWYEVEGRSVGPVPADEIRGLLERGTLTRRSNVVPEGSRTWATVAQYEGALGLPPVAPVAPPADEQTPVSDRDFLSALLLSIFLGWLGMDRFYLGRIGTGVLKLVTFGGLGIWWLIDVIMIATRSLTDADGLPLSRG